MTVVGTGAIMHRHHIHILSFILLAFAFIFRLSSLEAGEMEDALKKLRMGEQKIDFYGIFLDQDDRPVPDVKVHYTVSGYSLTGLAPRNTRGVTASDGDGLFEIHARKGGILYIDDVECTGYEFRRGNHPGSFEFRSNRTDRHRPDKEKPVIFRLRRKHTEAVVLRSCESSIRLNDNMEEKWQAWDFANGALGDLDRKNRTDYFWDYEVTGENNPEKGEWILHIKMSGEKAGIMVSDKLLYEAPADGYAKEVTLTFKYSDNPPLKHLYLRIRDCGMYARMDVEHGSVSEKGVYFSCKTVINPYGSWSLEPLFSTEQKGSSTLFVKCHNEADRAMEQQHFAPRPPFELWIKEGKAKY